MPLSLPRRSLFASGVLTASALGASLLTSCKPRPKASPSPFLAQVRSQLSLDRVLAAEAELQRGDTPAARLSLARACGETTDHAGAALALYPLLTSAELPVREEFVTHALAVGWLDEAAAVYRALPSHRPELTLRLATAYASRGRKEEAATLLRSLEKGTLEANAWLEGALLWLQLRQPKQAVRWARRGAERSTEGRTATLLVARCLFAAGQYPQVVSHLQQARLTEEPLADFWIGRAQLRSADPAQRKQGGERLVRVATDDPTNAVAAWEAGRALLKAGDARGATRPLSRALEAEYQTVLCYELLAEAYAKLGFQREALWARGRTRLARGQLTEAQILFQQSLERDPSRPAAYLDLAKSYSADLKPQKALEVLQRAQKISPGNLQVAMLKAAVLGRLERVPEQVKELERAAGLDPKRANEPLGELGKLFHGSQQYDRAIETLDRALRLEDGDALAHLYLGLCYARRMEDSAKAEQAVLHLLRAATAQPDFHYPWMNAGSTLLRMGRHAEAAACFRRAIDGDSRWDAPYVSLSQVLQRQKRPVERKWLLALYDRARKLEAERSRLEDLVSRQPKSAQSRFQLGDRLLRDGRHREAYEELIQVAALRSEWKEAQLRFADVCALLEFDDLQQEAEYAAR